MHNPRNGNRYFAILLLSMPVSSLLLGFLNHFLKFKIPLPLLLPISHILYFIIPFVIYLLITRQSIKAVLPLNRLSITNFMLILFMCLSIQPLLMFISVVSSLFFENRAAQLATDLNSFPLITALMVVSLTPSITEEITLRGVILTNYKHIPIKTAAIINGLFFGIMHLDFQQFLYAFTIGIVFSYFVYYTKSIFASMLGHFIINSTQTLIAYASLAAAKAAGITEIGKASYTMDEMGGAIVAIAVIAGIFLPTFIILFTTFISINKRKNIIDVLDSKEDFHPVQIGLFNEKKIIGLEFAVIIIAYLLNMVMLSRF